MAFPKMEIKSNKIIVVEGIDAQRFIIYALGHLQIDDVQVVSYSGITQLSAFLGILLLSPGYEMIKTLLICRDAENDAQAAIQSVKSSLVKTGLPSPDWPFQWAGMDKKVGFTLFPGVGKNGRILDGTLEDLCNTLIDDTAILHCVESYLECAAASGCRIPWPHKSKLHAYFSVTDYVGLKLGEAARAGAFDWKRDGFAPFSRMIREM